MKRRVCALAAVLVLLLSLSLCLLAYSTSESTMDASVESATFVPMTREEYIMFKAETEGISYEAAMAETDSNIEATLAAIPAPLDGFEAGSGFTDEYGVNTNYGYIVYVRDVPKTAGFIQVRMSVAATVISGPPDCYIAEIGSKVNVQPGRSGFYTIDGDGTATLAGDKQSVYLACTGNAEMTLDLGLTLGMSVEIIQGGSAVGASGYFRFPFTTGATYQV